MANPVVVVNDVADLEAFMRGDTMVLPIVSASFPFEYKPRYRGHHRRKRRNPIKKLWNLIHPKRAH